MSQRKVGLTCEQSFDKSYLSQAQYSDDTQVKNGYVSNKMRSGEEIRTEQSEMSILQMCKKMKGKISKTMILSKKECISKQEGLKLLQQLGLYDYSAKKCI